MNTQSGSVEKKKFRVRGRRSGACLADFDSNLPLFFKRLRSIGFSEECMGLHYGNIHRADLGDGEGQKNEQFLARQYYFPVWGTCWESVAGASLFLRFILHLSLLLCASGTSNRCPRC